jgi:hypothetical protein
MEQLSVPGDLDLEFWIKGSEVATLPISDKLSNPEDG